MSTATMEQQSNPNIMPTEPHEIAPCLASGPIATAASAAVEAARELGSEQWSSVLRAMCVPYVFGGMERIFASNEDPVVGVNEMLHSLAAFLKSTVKFGFPGPTIPASEYQRTDTGTDVEQTTGNHYGNLFKDFSQSSYWEEPLRLLRARLERNGIDIASLQGKEVLDAGCGGGRYTYAWKALGAKRAVGIDISTIGLNSAQQRGSGMEGVEFQTGNVLAIPFADHSWDVVFSNGILHHTVDWQQGVREMVRVLKPGGLGWLYLIENPGGLMWDLVEVLRVITHGQSRENARDTLHLLGVPKNRIFYMLDHVMVPINVRLTPRQIEDALRAAGATAIRRLNRGTDFDRVERIYQRDPYAEVKFGVGENRFVFSK